jgi:quinol monooxygenase YgiN
MEQLTLVIKFTAKPENKDEFKQILAELFETISHEENFVNATLHEALGHPEEFLVYETWNDNIEHFLADRMTKPYVITFEQKIVDLDIKREPSGYTPFAHFGTHLVK